MSAHHGPDQHEIIIVRHRGGDHDDDHHGGVWKIAFADFMTAMMCFFLVMWLINAANEQTKASVASYFNPVKLIDRNSSRKGLEDIGDGPNAVGMEAENPAAVAETKIGTEGQSKGGAADNQNSNEQSEIAKHSDSSLFADPYAVLAEIAAETGQLQNISAKGDGGAQLSGPATGASGGESYRDPFAPDFWSQQVASPEPAEASAQRAKTVGGEPAASVSERTDEEAAAPRKEEGTSEDHAEAADPGRQDAAPQNSERLTAEAEERPSAATEKAAAAVRADLAAAFKPGEALAGSVSVEATAEGVAISVTDQLDFGMFEIGSAVPRRELVLAMEKIAAALAQRKGTISINGHTDSRPFRSAAYDNWRLSGARAQSAYYMLARAGLDEKRVREIAGFADRRLKDSADPLSAVNRRIEIMLEVAE